MMKRLLTLLTVCTLLLTLPVAAGAENLLPYDAETVVSVQKLSAAQQTLATKIYNAAMICMDTVYVTENMTSDEVFDVVAAVVYDYPEIFHIDQDSCYVYTNGSRASYIEMNYTMSAGEYARIRRQLISAAEAWSKALPRWRSCMRC